MPFGFGRRRKAERELIEHARERLSERSLVFIGMMGAGKSAIGRRVAKRLGLDFVDADTEIEKAAGQTISEMFADHGEQYFRDGERRVIARLLGAAPMVVATGGGAFMNADTRQIVKERAVSIWLDAELDVLLSRVKRRGHRPLLKTGDPREILCRLLDERNPVYALADHRIVSRDVPHDVIVSEILQVLGSEAKPSADS